MDNKFVSPESIYARVKEELRSYFSTGSLDDLLFGVWTSDCIQKMERTYFPIHECAMDLWDHKCELPCDFKTAREVWLCATYEKGPITSPFVYYYQTDCRINPAPTPGDACGDCVDGYQCFAPSQTPTPVALPDLCNVPDEFRVTHKVMSQMNFTFRVSGLLKPGNYKTISKCETDSPNLRASCIDTFDIMGNKLITSFRQGTVFMSYYANPYINEAGYPEIPDNEPFQKYLYYYLRYMVFQQLFDQSTDESFNQARAKRDDAEKKMWDAYINAKNYALAGDIYSVEKSIVRSLNKNNRFKIR